MDSSDTKSPLTGGCQCGDVRYEITGAPHEIYVCHCRECQKQSASAFGISVRAGSADVRLLKGALQSWSRSTDSGRTLRCFFCSICGSRVWHGDRHQANEISIKGGSLDDPVDLSNAIHIWTIRKLPGVIIPDNARQYAREPDPPPEER